MIMHSVEAFLRWGKAERIFVAVSGEWLEHCRELFAQYDGITVILGGEDRSGTVERLTEAAFAAGGDGNDILAAHDAARPFVSAAVIERCVRAAEEYGVSGAALPATDTVLQCAEGFVASAPPRSEMFLAQTPQCFKLGLFREVWERLPEEDRRAATDVCGMFCRAGVTVRIVEGSGECFKITAAEDLKRAEQMAAQGS